MYFNPLNKVSRILLKKGNFYFSYLSFFRLFTFFKSFFKFEKKIKDLKLNTKEIIYYTNLSIKKKQIKKIYIYINPLFIFKHSIEILKPLLNVYSKIISGKTQKIPTMLKNNESYKITFRWFKNTLSKTLKYKYLFENLCYEFLCIYYCKSVSLKTRKEFYNLILKNRNLLKFIK